MQYRQVLNATSRPLRWFVAGCVWLCCVVAGLMLLARYDTTPGAGGDAPRAWPRESRISLTEHGNTLLMFAHPRCPCTRASLGELARILSRCPDGVTSYVVFFQPLNASETWGHSDQIDTAARTPGVTVVRDNDGVEARLFEAATSGHTLLYNAAGELLFSGGITLARGHAGDNPGRSAIESQLTGSIGGPSQTPVFGCPILAPR